jgi:hypothetical protein
MFCPQCKAEYREGFKHCPECDVDLVLSLPREPEEPAASEDDWQQSAVVVWQGTDSLLADRIVQILEGAGVELYSQRFVATVVPIPSGRVDYAVWVHRKDEIRARDLIRALLEGVEDESGPRAPYPGLEDAT